jgi:hypothetical protein
MTTQEQTTTNAVTIQHSIRKVRGLVCKAFKSAKVLPAAYHYNAADQNGGAFASYSVTWSDQQARDFNAVLDSMEESGNHPELRAVEIY